MIALALAAALVSQQGTWIGFGQMSCATWNSGRSTSDAEGRAYILGWWTGRNSGLTAEVGHTTDGAGIIEEVRLVCRAEPSLGLGAATFRVWETMRASGR